MKKLIYLIVSISFLITTSCCETKKAVNSDQKKKQKEMETTSVNYYKRVSKTKIKDQNKPMDTPFIYDYEVSEKKTLTTRKNVNKLLSVINEKSNFFEDGIYANCTEKPDFFIEVNNDVYGFSLATDCPMLYHITYNKSKETVEKKYILLDKVALFQKATNKIMKIDYK